MIPVEAVYFHVPFCVHHCFYCDYPMETRGEEARRPELARAWVEGVEEEWRLLGLEGRVALDGPLSSVYMGGGTPSVLGVQGVEGVARILEGPLSKRDEGVEWTVEANPEDVTPELLAGWKELGVTRISLGIQSFQDRALRWLGRLHDGKGARRALDQVLEAGFARVSVDLLFGLPAEVDRDWELDLLRFLETDVGHVTLYGLDGEEPDEGGEAGGEEDSSTGAADPANEYLLASSLLSDAGFEHYELESLARPGQRSGHGRAYASGGPYLGLGPAAHSFLPPMRRWNLAEWGAYSTMVRSGRLPLGGCERPGSRARALERIWMRLRTAEGLPRTALPAGVEGMVEAWREEGWVKADHRTLRFTPSGWVQLDRRVAELAEYLST